MCKIGIFDGAAPHVVVQQREHLALRLARERAFELHRLFSVRRAHLVQHRLHCARREHADELCGSQRRLIVAFDDQIGAFIEVARHRQVLAVIAHTPRSDIVGKLQMRRRIRETFADGEGAPTELLLSHRKVALQESLCLLQPGVG